MGRRRPVDSGVERAWHRRVCRRHGPQSVLRPGWGVESRKIVVRLPEGTRDLSLRDRRLSPRLNRILPSSRLLREVVWNRRFGITCSSIFEGQDVQDISKASIRTMGSIQPPIQWLLALSPGLKRLACEDDHSPHLLSKLRMSGAITPLNSMASMRP